MTKDLIIFAYAILVAVAIVHIVIIVRYELWSKGEAFDRIRAIKLRIMVHLTAASAYAAIFSNYY